MSLTMTATFAFTVFARILRSSVVLPAPRKPLSKVTGNGLLGCSAMSKALKVRMIANTAGQELHTLQTFQAEAAGMIEH